MPRSHSMRGCACDPCEAYRVKQRLSYQARTAGLPLFAGAIDQESVARGRQRRTAGESFSCWVCQADITTAMQKHRGRARVYCVACSRVMQVVQQLVTHSRDSAPGRRWARGLQRDQVWRLETIDIARRVAAGKCEVTGIPFDLDISKRAKPFAPSIDRRDSSLGYTPENVQVVVWIYNAAKSHWSHAEVMRMARALCDRDLRKITDTNNPRH